MSLLAHTTYGALGFETEKRDLRSQIQQEIGEARRIQKQLACTWTEALIAARNEVDEDAHILRLAEYYQPY